MIKIILLFLLVIFVFFVAPIYVGYQASPDFTRQGQLVLINNEDTARIEYEEKYIFPLKNQENTITVKYKDKLGIYHTDCFPCTQIVNIQF